MPHAFPPFSPSYTSFTICMRHPLARDCRSKATEAPHCLACMRMFEAFKQGRSSQIAHNASSKQQSHFNWVALKPAKVPLFPSKLGFGCANAPAADSRHSAANSATVEILAAMAAHKM